jgi:hypothetical protein
MQLIMALLFIDVSLPSNAQQVFSKLDQMVNLGIIDTTYLDEVILGFTVEEEEST